MLNVNHAECHDYINDMLVVVMSGVIMLSVVAPFKKGWVLLSLDFVPKLPSPR